MPRHIITNSGQSYFMNDINNNVCNITELKNIVDRTAKNTLEFNIESHINAMLHSIAYLESVIRKIKKDNIQLSKQDIFRELKNQAKLLEVFYPEFFESGTK